MIRIEDRYDAPMNKHVIWLDRSDDNRLKIYDEGEGEWINLVGGGGTSSIEDYDRLQELLTECQQTINNLKNMIPELKKDLAIDNVDNTSDEDKPLSNISKGCWNTLRVFLYKDSTPLVLDDTSLFQSLRSTMLALCAIVGISVDSDTDLVTIIQKLKAQIDNNKTSVDEEISKTLTKLNEVVTQITSVSNSFKELQLSIKNQFDQVNQVLSEKVNIQEGKGLSSNDYTDAEKEKLQGLHNYDDTQIRGSINSIQSTVNEHSASIENINTQVSDTNKRIDTLVNSNATEVIDTFNEIEQFLNGITNTQTLTGLLLDLETKLTQSLNAHIQDQQNPHNVTKSQVGLGNVDNTSDKNKPISDATQAALNQIEQSLSNKVDVEDGKGLSTNDFTNENKAKLDEIDTLLSTKEDKEVPLFYWDVNNEELIEGDSNSKLSQLGTYPKVKVQSKIGTHLDSTYYLYLSDKWNDSISYTGSYTDISGYSTDYSLYRITYLYKRDNKWVFKAQVLGELLKYGFVEKVAGKQLSTEDFTTLLKTKLEGLTNYDDSTLTTELNALKSRLDTILDEDNTTAVIDTFQEIEAFLQGVTNTETLTGLLQEMKQEITQLVSDNYVNISDPQDISGAKTFTSPLKISGHTAAMTDGRYAVIENGIFKMYPGENSGFAGGVSIYNPEGDKLGEIGIHYTDNLVDEPYIEKYYFGAYDKPLLSVDKQGNVAASSYKIINGTSSQILLANGTVKDYSVMQSESKAMLSTGVISNATLAGFDTNKSRVYSVDADLGDGVSYSAILSVSGGGPSRYFQIMGGRNDKFLKWRTTNSAITELSDVHRLLDDNNYADILNSVYTKRGDIRYGGINNFMVGETKQGITTAQFIEKIKSFGFLNSSFCVTRNSFMYVNNDYITDSGVGIIDLVGALIEIHSNGSSGKEVIIRVTTAPASIIKDSIRNAVFIYRNFGEQYFPNWKRLANTSDINYNAGDEKTPIYFDNGVPKPLSNVSVHAYGKQSATGYIKLGELRPNNGNGHDSLHIIGDVGGWSAINRDSIDICIANRNGIYFSGFVKDKASSTTKVWDIGINTDNEVYLIYTGQYGAYNLLLFTLSSIVQWDGSLVTPTNTDFTLLSESTNVARFDKDGKAKNAITADKLGQEDVGSPETPIYLKGGVPTPCNQMYNIQLEDLLTYGVEWESNVSDPHLTRIGNPNLHKSLPIQSSMRGCIAQGNKIQYYLDKDNWRYKEGYKNVRGENYTENLLLGSGVVKENQNYLTASYNIVDTIQQGEEVTITIWGELGEGKSYFSAFNSGDLVSISQLSKVAEGVYRATASWRTNSTISNNELNIFAAASSTTSTSRIDKIKLERGTNTNTVWTPAESETDNSDRVLARLDGYDGTVRVQVPKFYIKSEVDGNKRRVKISTTQIDSSWTEQPEILIDAYRSTVLNTVPQDMGYLSTLPVNSAVSIKNTSTYCRGGSNRSGSDQYLSTDLYRTDLGKCRTAISRALMRTYSRNAGSEVLSYQQYKNIFYWLYVIEYANFNSQETFNSALTSDGYHQGGLGPGLTTMDKWSEYNSYNPLAPNGYTNEFGNGTGVKDLTIPQFTYGTDNTVKAAQTLKSVRWRGLEDPFGHIWHNVDGVIIDADAANHPNNMNYVYTTNDPSKYGDTLASMAGMTLSGLEIHQDGYTKEWDLGTTAEIIPKLMGGNTTQYKCDYHWTGEKNTSLRTLLLGGSANHGGLSGLGYFYSSHGVGASDALVGFRTSCVIV